MLTKMHHLQECSTFPGLPICEGKTLPKTCIFVQGVCTHLNVKCVLVPCVHVYFSIFIGDRLALVYSANIVDVRTKVYFSFNS